MHGVGRRALAALLMGALAGLLVAGCAEDQAAPSEPIWTTTGTPTPTKPSTPSATPKKETIEEFLDKWGQVSVRMQNTGDTSEFERMSSHECESCQSLIDHVSSIYEAGGYVRTDRWSDVAITETAPQGGIRSVAFSFTGAPTTYTESSSGPKVHLEGGEVRMRAELARAGASWQIRYYAVQP